MKLQVHGQSLRFRLDEAEFSALLGAQTITNHTRIAGGGFSQTIRLGEVAQVFFEATTPGHWQLTLPRSAVAAYGEQLPCREGLDFWLPGSADAGADGIGITFDVDVRDSIRTRGAGNRRRAPLDTAN